MALEIIGAGFGRTGTLSTKLALEQLGYGPCYHMLEVFQAPGAPELWEKAAFGAPDWEAIFNGYRATVDWPAASFYKALAAAYPEAKVLLTVRESGAWYESIQKTIFHELPEAIAKRGDAWGRMIHKAVVELFDGRLHDRDHVIGVYEAHNAEVRRSFSKERLLEFDAKEGWEPLCAFLGRLVPEGPFPRSNSTEEFLARRKAPPE